MASYRELYEAGIKALETANIDEARLDARLLLEYVCELDHGKLLMCFEDKATEDHRARYMGLIDERKRHIPLQYITGKQDFMGLTFKVNENVLIPRMDTEILVECILKELRDGMKLLDICTGSGCILLSLLNYSNYTTGVGLDISGKALEVATDNANRLGLSERAEFMEGNALDMDSLGLKEASFDVIVSNPPYIASGEISGLMAEVKNEPILALDGGVDGLDFYKEIIPYAWWALRKEGFLFFEIGYDEAVAVKSLMESQGFKDVVVKKDYAGLDRVVSGYKL